MSKPIMPKIEKKAEAPKVGPAAIEYHKRNVYGNEQKYITDPTLAAHVSRLTGTKTLMDNHIQALQALGHTVTHVPQN